MSKGWLIFIIVLAVIAGVMVLLYFIGKRLQKKQNEQQEQMNAASQTMSLLVIDKKKLRLKDAQLPAAVMNAAPRLSKIAKMPVVKAKVGPKIMTFLCDPDVYKVLPVKRECKVVVSGLYIMSVKSARGGLEQPVKKKRWFGGKSARE